MVEKEKEMRNLIKGIIGKIFTNICKIIVVAQSMSNLKSFTT